MSEQYTYKSKYFRTEANWRSERAIDIRNQSIDICIKSEFPSFNYETSCFTSIATTLQPNEFAIGPHLLDLLFEISGWGSYIRPDGLIFQRENQYWSLTAMIEIKIGKLKMNRKLNGFSDLLSRFRQNPDFLPILLQEHIGDIYTIPSYIEIPDNTSVQVIFANPKNRGECETTHDTLFNIRHIKIKK